jgi:hypothetical protein
MFEARDTGVSFLITAGAGGISGTMGVVETGHTHTTTGHIASRRRCHAAGIDLTDTIDPARQGLAHGIGVSFEAWRTGALETSVAIHAPLARTAR